MQRFGLIGLIIGALLLPAFAPATAQDSESAPIRIWWPEELYATTEQDTVDALFAGFNDSNVVEIAYRVYQRNASGMTPVEQLNTTQTVAPDAVPDVALIRRNEMLTMVQAVESAAGNIDESIFAIENTVLQSIEAWDSRVIITEMTPISPELQLLGEVNGVLYGLPYMIDVQHAIFDSTAFDETPSSTAALLTTDTPIVFPGRPQAGRSVNDFVLGLYTSFGGRLLDENNLPILDEAPLRDTVNYIAEIYNSNLISSNLLAYRQPQDYLQQLLDDEVDYAIVNSAMYMGDTTLQSYAVSPLPIAETPITFVDGWVWVLLTTDNARQRDAREFVGWMMETDQLIDISEAFNTIPTQERALNALDNPYLETIQEMLMSTRFVPGRRNQATVALQTAFEAILDGTSADAAITAALATVRTTTND